MFIRRKSHTYYHRFTEEEQDGYVFSLSTLWCEDLSINTKTATAASSCACTSSRWRPLRASSSTSKRQRERPAYSKYLQEYHDIIYKSRVSMSEYDKWNRKTLFIFNTPSVNGHLSWKHEEYLCEMKAIISTPPQKKYVMPG